MGVFLPSQYWAGALGHLVWETKRQGLDERPNLHHLAKFCLPKNHPEIRWLTHSSLAFQSSFMVILEPAVFPEVTVPEHCEVCHKTSRSKNFTFFCLPWAAVDCCCIFYLYTMEKSSWAGYLQCIHMCIWRYYLWGNIPRGICSYIAVSFKSLHRLLSVVLLWVHVLQASLDGRKICVFADSSYSSNTYIYSSIIFPIKKKNSQNQL